MHGARGTTVNERVDGGGRMAFLALPMTTTATLTLPESEAIGMMSALAEDPVLGERTIDASEVAPGRWEVLI